MIRNELQGQVETKLQLYFNVVCERKSNRKDAAIFDATYSMERNAYFQNLTTRENNFKRKGRTQSLVMIVRIVISLFNAQFK